MSALPIMLPRVRAPERALPATNVAVPAALADRRSGDTIAAPAKPAPPALREVFRQQAFAQGGAPASTRRNALIEALLRHVPAADRAAAKTAIPAILNAAREAGNTDANQIGYLLATAQTESDFGANMIENGHGKDWFNVRYGGEDGNRLGTNDGYAYRGRGYVQTTHAGRYAELSRQLGLPDTPVAEHGKAVLDRNGRPKMEAALVAHPEQLAQPQLAAKALVVGVAHNAFTHNAAAALEKTVPAGRKPGDVDFYHARAIVNGIVRSQAETIAAHATTYARVLDSYQHSVLGTPDAR